MTLQGIFLIFAYCWYNKIMDIDYNEKDWATPCPKYDCRKAACKCGLKYVYIPTSLGDDSEGSNAAPKNGAYCNALVVYEANNHVYIYSKEGVPTLIDVDASDISTLEQEVRKAQRDIVEFREDIDRFAYFFDTVADMKAATNLKAGDYARTLGFRSINDGGGALYKITSTGTANEMDIISVSNLFANLIAKCVSIKQLGAKGDGTSNDTNILQYTFSNYKNVYIPTGTYKIESNLSLNSNMEVNGAGENSVILAGDSVDHLLNMISKENVTIENIKIDGNAHDREARGVLSSAVYGINVDGSRNIIIKNTVFTNLGYLANNAQGLAGGNMLSISVAESSTGYDIENCVIEGCKFIDPEARSSFGIRMVTEWNVETSNHYAKNNVIRNCYFTGNCYNNIEIAGPRTVYNIVDGCFFENSKAIVFLEADKGASYNKYINNTVDGHEPNPAAQSGMTFNCAWDGNTDYPVGNMFVDNTIRNVKLNNVNTSNVFKITYAQDTIIDNLTVENVAPYQTSQNGNAIYIDQSTNTSITNCKFIGGTNCRAVRVLNNPDNDKPTIKKVTISNCTISGYYIGIQTYGAIRRPMDLIIEGCTISTDNFGISLGAGTDATIIKGNIFDTCYRGINVTDGGKATIIDNYFINMFEASHYGIIASGDDTEISVQGNTFNGCGMFTTLSNNKNRIYANISSNATGSRVKTVTYSSAAPDSGTWVKGDIIYNNDPVAGGSIGWVCTSDGAPGTWKTFGDIAA